MFAAKTTLMNRVNQIYNDDLAIKMIFVADTDAPQPEHVNDLRRG